ncbi:MAG TPA: GNAT family protein [Caulobacteraceae bacterium]|nr:GNAT family protein [Caulobacteraceae bacterium]
MADPIRPVPLESAGVRLEPLDEAHRESLRAAGDAPEIWTHIPYVARSEGFDPWFDGSLRISGGGAEAVWAVRAPDGVVVGSTRYLNIDAANKRLEIGSTWYAPRVWATRINPACKLALMRHAFETLGMNRVEYKTDNLNTRSQAAIAKLGAVKEGVFRAHVIRRDGTLRDTVYFSIIAPEWPAVRHRLEARLKEHA